MPSSGNSWHYHGPLQHVGSCGPPCKQASNHIDIRDATVPGISRDNLPLNYGSAWSHSIVGSGFEHVDIPQLASYDLWQPNFTPSNDFQPLDSSSLEVAPANAGAEHHSNISSAGGTSTGQSNIDAAWSYALADQHFEDSAYLQPSYQALPPVWSIGPLAQPPSVSSAHLLQYQNFTTASPFSHANLPPNNPFTVQQTYQEALVPLPPRPETPQYSAPAAVFLPRQHPAYLAARKTTKTAVKNRFQCHQGCTKTFGRLDDLHRHMKKHEAHQFKCFDYDCSKTFYRLDKLRDHAKQVHGFNL